MPQNELMLDIATAYHHMLHTLHTFCTGLCRLSLNLVNLLPDGGSARAESLLSTVESADRIFVAVRATLYALFAVLTP